MRNPNNLSEDREGELLIMLMDECAEVQQQASKVLRLGVNVTGPDQETTNAQLPAAEAGE